MSEQDGRPVGVPDQVGASAVPLESLGEQPEIAARTGRGHRSASKIPTYRRYALCKELATGEKTKTQLAKEYGVSVSGISQFARRNADRIGQIQAAIDSEFAGLWLADKVQRIASYQDDMELSADGSRADHFEQIRTRTDIRKAVAEELGQLPTRGVQVSGTVTHILEGVSIDDLT